MLKRAADLVTHDMHGSGGRSGFNNVAIVSGTARGLDVDALLLHAHGHSQRSGEATYTSASSVRK